jgi:hypothetical protein
MGEKAEAMHEGKRRPEDRPGETGQKRERREVSEQDVLEHVEAEELLAQRVQRTDERAEEDRDPGSEERDPPTGNHGPAGA